MTTTTWRAVTPLITLCLTIASTRATAQPARAATAPIGPTTADTARPGLWRGIDYAGMDRSVNPLADLDAYASARWYAANPIPPDQGSWSTGQLVKQRNQEILRSILDSVAAVPHTDPTMTDGRLAAFYRSAMDEAAIERAGLSPLVPVLARINAIRTHAQLWQRLPALYRETTVFAPVALRTDTDPRDVARLIVVFDAGGLGLPDAAYYLRDDERTRGVRARYTEHIARTLALLGESAPRAVRDAAQVVAFETRLARASASEVADTRPMPLASVDALTPGLSWRDFAIELGVPRSTDAIVPRPEFLRTVRTMLSDEPVARWRTYLRWQLARSVAPALPRVFADESFDFNQRVLGGRVQDMPRWKRAVIWTDELLGEDLGQLYVARQFTDATRARVRVMIADLVAALRDRLATLDWLSESARRDARARLDRVTFRIGHPDRWRDYSGLAIDDGPFVLNYLRARRFANGWMLGRLGKPRAPDEWENTPPTINAYCDPVTMQVVFSAGILQPPFFDPDASDEVNYAEIGSVIGHELTHLFWWTGDDAVEFTRRTRAIEQRYAAYTLEDGSSVNGTLTLNENVADIGGLTIAYLAWQRSLGGRVPPPPINGLTAEQRFFVAYAQSWRIRSRPETARMRLTTDPHAPGHFRIVGPPSTMPQFYAAFGAFGPPPSSYPEGIW